jgi:hypothetical protein
MTLPAVFVSQPIPLRLGSTGADFRRADIKFTGIEQAGPSFEGRVFLNNPHAGLDTPLTVANGYAGSFHVYGYGIYPQDQRKTSGSPPHGSAAISPIEKVVIATEPVRAAAAQGAKVTVTVVPVYSGLSPKLAVGVLRVENVEILIQ